LFYDQQYDIIYIFLARIKQIRGLKVATFEEKKANNTSN